MNKKLKISAWRQFESRKTDVVLFILSNSTQIPLLEALIIVYTCMLNYFLSN